VGLSFQRISEDLGNGHDASSNAGEDHYEVLQLSPNADVETIHRVFRILAQRYHPDNQETGNVDLFRKIKESYDILSDPEKRAAYDVRRNAHRADRLRIFSDWQSSSGVEAEKRKRQGILALLYAQRIRDPHQPGFTIRDLEDMLACPREHLEFSLWFLKERKYISRSDNNRHAITYEGVEAVEHDEVTVRQYSRPRLAEPA
jgi:curved DNA-binding protein CbpA